MATRAEVAAGIREVVERLRRLVDDAATASDAPDASSRKESAEFLKQAIDDCQDAIDAILRFRGTK